MTDSAVPAQTTPPHAGAIPNAPSLLPDLTKETWEYLELRLWASFSKKLWLLLSAVLTVVALLGLLGMNSWLDSKLQTALAKQTEAFDQSRRSYEERVTHQLVTATMLFALESRLYSDTNKYVMHASRIQRSLPPDQLKALQDKPAIATLFLMHTPGLQAADEFRKQYKEARNTLGLPALTDLDALGDDLSTLAKNAGHILALKQAIADLKARLGADAAVDLRSLEASYEGQIYPIYLAQLRKFSGISSLTNLAEENISTLPSDAKFAFAGIVPASSPASSSAAKK